MIESFVDEITRKIFEGEELSRKDLDRFSKVFA